MGVYRDLSERLQCVTQLTGFPHSIENDIKVLSSPRKGADNVMSNFKLFWSYSADFRGSPQHECQETPSSKTHEETQTEKRRA